MSHRIVCLPSAYCVAPILVGIFFFGFGGRPKRYVTLLTFLVAVPMIALYTVFTGATPSVVRAALMCSISLFAPLVRRRFDLLASISIAATIMVIFDPDALADLGFQLSFMAMLGIATLAEPLFALTKRPKIPRFLGIAIAVSLAAQTATIPLVALSTGEISTVALPATLVAGVALPPLMITGIAAGMFGAIFPPLAIPLGLLVWPFASWILWWVEFLGNLSWAWEDVSWANPLWVVVYYAIIAACLWLVNRRKRTPLVPRDWANAGLSIAVVALWATFIGLIAT
jgi:competence protein ComEC